MIFMIGLIHPVGACGGVERIKKPIVRGIAQMGRGGGGNPGLDVGWTPNGTEN